MERRFLWMRGYGRSRIAFVIYNIIGFIMQVIIMLSRYLELNLLNTGLLLGGWDTPFYAWHARYVIQYGPWYLMQRLSYPNLYTQLVGFFGYLFGNVVLAQRALPLALGMLLTVLYASISYRISNNVHVAGLTAIISPVAVGTLRLVGEYNRNLMAYVLGLSNFYLVSSSNGKISMRRYLLIFLLSLVMAATHFETFFLMSLSFVLATTAVKNLKRIWIFPLISVSAFSILIIAFPAFLGRYYFNLMPQSYNLSTSYGFFDLVFWSVGSVYLLPIAIIGLASLYYATRRKETKDISLLILVFSTLLLALSFVLVHTNYGAVAIRAILILPVPIILALAIKEINQFVKRLSIKVELKGHKRRIFHIRGKEKAGFIIAILLSAIVFLSLTYTSIEARGMTAGPFLKIEGYRKIIEVSRYLANNNLDAPIFMFHGSSVWCTDYYRAYIGIEIGEHLAYFGDLENLINLRPTYPPFASPEKELAAFESEKYLRDMLGNATYTIYPQKVFVRDLSDLRLHPLVYIVPELYDAPLPFYIKRFQVADGVYVVPSLTEIEDLVTPRMKLETERGVTEVKGSVINGTIIRVEIGNGSSWYRLSGYPSCFIFKELEQGGALSYPEYDPRRFDGAKAVTGNDPAEDMQYWRIGETLSNASIVTDEAIKKEGDGSLQVVGTTDPWGNVYVLFDPAYDVDLSDYITVSWWGIVDQKYITWVLTLQDASGYQASYWNIFGGHIEQDSEIGQWKRLVANLTQPTEKDQEFDSKKVDWIGISTFLGKPDRSLTFYVDDLTVDKQLELDEWINKGRVLPNENLVVYFSVKEDSQC